jgi:hypothetical protein
LLIVPILKLVESFFLCLVLLPNAFCTYFSYPQYVNELFPYGIGE